MPIMVERKSFTYKLSSAQQNVLAEILRTGNYLPMRVEHTIVAVKTADCNIALYKSGKCLVQGRGASEFVTFVLEPLVLQSAELGYEDTLHPEATQPHMGVDESGKGDFFGPIVSASVYVDPALAEAMRDLDVKDSKRITSDKKALDLGRELRKILGRRFSVVKIGPQAYNRLYAKMRSVNRLLSWAHARAIENLLDTVPDCPRAISDKFGNEQQLKQALMKKGRDIELEQKTHAESDLAVAAASILAREGFLYSLYDLREKYKLEFPKGASAAVKEWATELVKKHGPEVLVETVKCHFKTTDEVLAQLKLDRSALPAEGQVKSKPARAYYGRSKAARNSPTKS